MRQKFISGNFIYHNRTFVNYCSRRFVLKSFSGIYGRIVSEDVSYIMIDEVGIYFAIPYIVVIIEKQINTGPKIAPTRPQIAYITSGMQIFGIQLLVFYRVNRVEVYLGYFKPIFLSVSIFIDMIKVFEILPMYIGIIYKADNNQQRYYD